MFNKRKTIQISDVSEDDSRLKNKLRNKLGKVGLMSKPKEPEMKVNRKLSARGTGSVMSTSSGTYWTGFTETFIFFRVIITQKACNIIGDIKK